MPVTGIAAFAFDVPDLEPGVRFYRDAGLSARSEGSIGRFYCDGQKRESIVLFGGAPKKRLRYIRLRAKDLDQIAAAVPRFGGTVIESLDPGREGGLWVRDEPGLTYHLVDEPGAEARMADAFTINAPGRIVRKNRPGMRPRKEQAPVRPQKLGHVALFTPDVVKSAALLTHALGMGVADKMADVLAFCCARKNSDHHLIALAKAPGPGFHHGSFAVSDPDEVGRAGRALSQKAARSEWGFGRHSIGSNFFHYIQDPWGSWFEYYSDMDYIEDLEMWQTHDWTPEDALHNWGPAIPDGFTTNREI